MKWYQNLYIGQTASRKKDDIIEKIENEQNLLSVYLLTIAPDERNQLEIITPTVYYRQSKRKGYPMIVGIACGMKEAKELLRQMTEEVYQKTGSVNLRKYFMEN